MTSAHGFGHQVSPTLVALNATLILLYSPNFASALFPAVKALQVVGFAMLVLLLLARRPQIKPLDLGLLGFLACVLVSTLANAARFDNAEGIYIAFSFVLKCLHVIAFFLYCRSDTAFLMATRSLLAVLALFAAHGLLQFVAVPMGWATQHGTLDFAGYEYTNLGWLGIYRVALVVDGAEFVRVQSFFQEPGFFAFYMLFGLMLCHHPVVVLGRRLRTAAAVLFAAVTLMTLSLTGVVLLGLYAVFKLHSTWLKAAIGMLVVLVTFFIVTNDSEFIAKAGSFEMRLEHYALLELMARSWMSLVFGIGIGNDAMLGEMRVNNVVAELYMYASPLGLLVMAIILVGALRRSAHSNHVLLMTVAYALSTPMAWSPLFYCAIYLTAMAPTLCRRRSLAQRSAAVTASTAPNAA
jgi:hypothetical protein